MSRSIADAGGLAAARACTRRTTRRRGFTLVETMIVVLVLAILGAIAFPSYLEMVRKGRRSAAMSGIALVMQAQERWRSNNASYQASIGSLPGAPTTSDGGYYSLSLVEGSATANGYTVLASVRSGTSQASDTKCAFMSATVNNGTITYGSKDSEGAANDPDPCWIK